MSDLEIVYRTDRLNFIRPNTRYINEILELINNPAIYNWIMNDYEEFTLENEMNWIERHQEDYTFSLIDRATNSFIGNCSITVLEDGRGELGIFLSPAFQNQGLGTEALSELIRIGFEEINLNEITLIVFSNNERAIRCYERLGFQEYQRVNNVCMRNNEYIDDIYMRLTR